MAEIYVAQFCLRLHVDGICIRSMLRASPERGALRIFFPLMRCCRTFLLKNLTFNKSNSGRPTRSWKFGGGVWLQRAV